MSEHKSYARELLTGALSLVTVGVLWRADYAEVSEPSSSSNNYFSLCAGAWQECEQTIATSLFGECVRPLCERVPLLFGSSLRF